MGIVDTMIEKAKKMLGPSEADSPCAKCRANARAEFKANHKGETISAQDLKSACEGVCSRADEKQVSERAKEME